jgi:CheY-like chemotaxis protein
MRSKVILLAEDNPDDAFIFEMMFRRAKFPDRLKVVRDGQQAIDWLSGKGEYADREKFPLPDVLSLDLKMPIKNGFEVLEWLRAQNQFRDLPVIILSSSDDSKDLKRAQQLGITKYFVKSPKLQDVMDYLRVA